MKLTRLDLSTLAQIADETESREAFLQRLGGYPIELLDRIWMAVHCPMVEIRGHTGLSQAEFYRHFLVAPRTIQDWENGRRTPPLYVRLLLAEASGYLGITITALH